MFSGTLRLAQIRKFIRGVMHWHFRFSIIMYRYSRGRWSNEGVKTLSVTRVRDIVTVTCASSHLTSFAVLVDVGGAQASVLTSNIFIHVKLMTS